MAVAAPGARADGDAGSDRAPRATLYAFFATWCVPCRVELPHLQRLHEEYRERGLKVVLVSEDAPSSASQIPSFLARYGVTAEWILDDESALLERYNPSANVPFTALLDASGKLVYAHAAYEPGDERLIEAAVIRVLGRAPEQASGGPSARVVSNSQGLGVWRTSRFDDTNGDGEIDERLAAAVARIEVAGYTENYSASVRVDGAVLDEEVAGEDADARPERVQLSARLGPARIVAGDHYAQFGRGVTLSLRRVDPLGLDTSIQGARVDVGRGDAELTVLGGFSNPQNLDPIELTIVGDVRDVITGAEARYRVGEDREVGVYGVFVHAGDASETGMDIDWTVGGASTSLAFGEVRVAADAAVGRRDGVSASGRDTMWAAYTSAQWTRGRWTALVEGKAYRRWEIGRADRSLLYHEPPTLEREDQEVPGNADAVGGRGRLELRLPAGISVFGNALAYRFTDDGAAPLDGDLATHGFAGVDKRWDSGGSAALQAGYRDENRADGGDRLSLWHADFDLAWPLTDKHSVTLKWNHRSETKDLSPLPNDLSFVRGLGVGTVAWSGLGALSLLYGYSTEDATTPTHYPAAELLAHLPSGGQARLFVGSLTGGRVCVSGSCRDVPPFEGARLDLILRF